MRKERLVELLGKAPFGVNKQTLLDRHETSVIEQIADYLLANGVIVPPCKVGDVVYRVTTEWNPIKKRYEHFILDEGIAHAPVSILFITSKHDVFNIESLGKTVFLSREEAEAKLIEGGESE